MKPGRSPAGARIPQSTTLPTPWRVNNRAPTRRSVRVVQPGYGIVSQSITGRSECSGVLTKRAYNSALPVGKTGLEGIHVRDWVGHCPQLIKLIIRYSGPKLRNPCIIWVAGHARAALSASGNQSSLFKQALRLP